MKNALFCVMLGFFWLLLGSDQIQAKNIEQGKISPRLPIWNKPFMDTAEADWLSRFPLAVIDVENMENNPQCLLRIKNKNPKIILIGRVNLTEIVLPTVYRPIQSKFISEMGFLENEFLLRDTAGGAVVAPRKGGNYVFNISADCPPSSNGLRYNQFISNFLVKNVFSAPIWNGICVSPAWENVFDIVIPEGNLVRVDADKNNLEDDKYRFLMAWKKGVEDVIDSIVQKKQGRFVVIGDPRVPNLPMTSGNPQTAKFSFYP